jgi:3-carboxy-cis,cis-muconate cycloisomerase
MSYSLQQTSLLAPHLGDDELTALFSTDADIGAMLQFEQALAKCQASAGLIPQASAVAITSSLKSPKLDHSLLSGGIGRDGMVVPGLIAQLRSVLPTEARDHLHFGSTSQDVIDTSLMLRSKLAFGILAARLKATITDLNHASNQYGKNQLMARTRMQQALPIVVADRIQTWSAGFQSTLNASQNLKFPVQMGGPIGTLRNDALKKAIAKELALDVIPHNWHAERSPVVALANAASAITGAAGKLGMDVCLMAQNEFAEIALSGGGTSSAMHHKQNPIGAEALVTLARFNAVLISAMHQSLVHEQERSGAAWTLEWMVLPQMLVAAGAATRLTMQVLRSITKIGS